MTITIEAKPYEVRAELPGYGIFYIRRLGAGAEADLQERLKAAQKLIDDIKTKYQDIFDEETKLMADNDETGLGKLRKTDRYIEAQKEQDVNSKVLNEFSAYVNKVHLKLWRSDDPEAMGRLLSDFTMEEIRGFYQQVMTEADNA